MACLVHLVYPVVRLGQPNKNKRDKPGTTSRFSRFTAVESAVGGLSTSG
jgi:hypothetical protein